MPNTQQATLGTINPSTTSGAALAAELTAFGNAVQATNIGTTRPSYAQEGMLWVNNGSSTNTILYYNTGASDVPLFSIDYTTGVATLSTAPTFPPVPVESVVAADSIAVTPTVTGINTAYTVNLVGDTASPAASSYYGTNGSAVRGWYPLPVTPAPEMELALTQSGSTNNYTWSAAWGSVSFCIVGGAGGAVGSSGGAAFITLTNVAAGTPISVVAGNGGAAGASGQSSYVLLNNVNVAMGTGGAGTANTPGTGVIGPSDAAAVTYGGGAFQMVAYNGAIYGAAPAGAGAGGNGGAVMMMITLA